MNEQNSTGIHWSFWVIAIVGLIWNAMGGANFVMQMNPDAVMTVPETHRAIIEGRPIWATAGFAVGVFGGALGCLLLLLRKSAASYLFAVSLIGMIATMIHSIIIASSVVDFSAFEIIMMIFMPLLVAVFLIWYAKYAQGKNWIN